MLFGMILHSAVYSYLRGRIKMLIANSIQLINLGIIPLIVFIFNKELIRILIFTGIAWIAISGLFIIVIVAKLHFERNLFRESVRKLLNYGFQRIPGDVGIAAFFLIPAFMTAHIADFTTAGHVAFGVSLLNMVGGAFGPICLILLPQASHFIVKGEMNLLRKTADKILFWTILVTGLGLLIFEIFAESLINLYLGETFHDIILITRLVLLGSFGYTVYISLRSILDAYYIKAVNTKNIFISFVIFCILLIILWLFTDDYIFILLCFVISMLVLGILTLLDTYKIFSQGKLKKGI